METPTPPPPPPPFSSKEYRINRFKSFWRILMISNLALGAYMFTFAKKKNASIMDKKPAKPEAEHGESENESNVSSDTNAMTDPVATALVHEEPPILPVIPKPALEPIPEDQQRELFKWILEEKRKVKSSNPEERKRINEEKAILKQFIRAESFPRF